MKRALYDGDALCLFLNSTPWSVRCIGCNGAVLTCSCAREGFADEGLNRFDEHDVVEEREECIGGYASDTGADVECAKAFTV